MQDAPERGLVRAPQGLKLEKKNQNKGGGDICAPRTEHGIVKKK